jgi:uncharacterized protein (DUF2147 family)
MFFDVFKDKLMKVLVRNLVSNLLLALPLVSISAYAGVLPTGYWRATSPFFSGAPVAIIKTYMKNETLCGEIVKVLPLNKPVDASKGVAASGPVIMCGYKLEGNRWAGGRIYEQITARTYDSSITVSEDGKQLFVRGYKGPFYRTAKWYKLG